MRNLKKFGEFAREHDPRMELDMQEDDADADAREIAKAMLGMTGFVN